MHADSLRLDLRCVFRESHTWLGFLFFFSLKRVNEAAFLDIAHPGTEAGHLTVSQDSCSVLDDEKTFEGHLPSFHSYRQEVTKHHCDAEHTEHSLEKRRGILYNRIIKRNTILSVFDARSLVVSPSHSVFLLRGS